MSGRVRVGSQKALPYLGPRSSSNGCRGGRLEAGTKAQTCSNLEPCTPPTAWPALTSLRMACAGAHIGSVAAHTLIHAHIPICILAYSAAVTLLHTHTFVPACTHIYSQTLVHIYTCTNLLSLTHTHTSSGSQACRMSHGPAPEAVHTLAQDFSPRVTYFGSSALS